METVAKELVLKYLPVLMWALANSRRGPVLPDGMYILKQKIPIWVNFENSFNGRGWYVYGHYVYFMYGQILYFMGIHFLVMWYFFHFWYVVPIKIWQPRTGQRFAFVA
jgi:hypothetical protein